LDILHKMATCSSQNITQVNHGLYMCLAYAMFQLPMPRQDAGPVPGPRQIRQWLSVLYPGASLSRHYEFVVEERGSRGSFA
jgi:hypothetical protein